MGDFYTNGHASADNEFKDALSEHAAESALNDFNKAKTVNDPHPYLKGKSITSNYCAKVAESGALVIPLYLKGKLRLIQSIYKVGREYRKDFPKNSGKKGAYCFVDPKIKSKRVFVSEGFATACTVQMAYPNDVSVCAVDCTNLKPVVEDLLKQDFESIIVCADNDFDSKAGIKFSTKCLIDERVKVILADMKGAPGSDFNDIHIAYGIDEVKKRMEKKIKESKSDAFYPTKDDGFHFVIQSQKGGEKYEPDYWGYAEFCKREKSLITNSSGSYVYDKKLGHYILLSDLALESMVHKDTKKRSKPQQLNLFVKSVKAETYVNEVKPTENLINLKNGTLDIRTKKLTPNGPENFFLYRLDHAYDPSAECQEWQNFLKYIFEDNEEFINISAQIFGYILYGGYPWLHKAFVLYGEGRNGKSTFLDILKELLGDRNCSHVSMSKIDREFSAVDLIGKLANIVEESPTDKINAEIFKTATAGGKLRAAKKHQDEFAFPCHARLIFAANKMPHFGESTGGLNSRMYFLPFNKFIPEADRDATIFKKLCAELPGILNWSLAGLDILLEEKRLPESDAGKQVMEEFKEETNNVYEWCSEFIKYDENDLSDGLQPMDVYQRYKSYCNDNGRMPVNGNRFCKEIKSFISEKYQQVDQQRITRSKKRVYKKVICTAPSGPGPAEVVISTSRKGMPWSYPSSGFN